MFARLRNDVARAQLKALGVREAYNHALNELAVASISASGPVDQGPFTVS